MAKLSKADQQALDELKAYIASRTEKTNTQSDKRSIASKHKADNRDASVNEKIKETALKNAKDPEWKKNNLESNRRRAQNPEWKKKNLEANRRRAQDPEWKKKHALARERLKNDPSWRENVAEGNRKKAKDPAWIKAHADSRKCRYKPLVAGEYGIYHNLTTLTKELVSKGLYSGETSAGNCIRAKMKKDPKNYYYITQEEYDALMAKKGKK